MKGTINRFSWLYGDVREAQKDMLADGLGAITSACLFWLQKKK